MITAHITIILYEEENQLQPMVRVASETSHSSESFLAEGSPKNQKGKMLDRDVAPLATLPPEASVPVDGEGNSRATHHPMVIPEGEKA